jgi:hypothetical protein
MRYRLLTLVLATGGVETTVERVDTNDDDLI